MVPFLDRESRGQVQHTRPARCAQVQVVVQSDNKDPNQLFELLVDLDKSIVSSKQQLQGKHSYIDSDYMRQVEAACMADDRVKAEVRSLNLPVNATVCVEPWAYATDGMNDMSERTTMVSQFHVVVAILAFCPCYPRVVCLIPARRAYKSFIRSVGSIYAFLITLMPTTMPIP